MENCNFRITSQFPYCANALSLDIYKGCTHRCEYCFARTVTGFLKSDIDYDTANLRSYSQVLRLIKGEYTGTSNKTLQYLIAKKQPLHIGGMADPFPYKVEEKLGYSKKFIEEVGDYPCIWSTKNPIPAYADLMAKGNHIIQCSIIGFGEKFRQIEHGTVSPEERLENLKAFKGKAKKIIIRFQPIIPWLFNDKALEDYIQRISTVADAVTIEFLKKDSGEKFVELSKTVGLDLDAEFKKLKTTEGKDYILPMNIRLNIALKIKKLAHKYGLEFYCAENGMRNLGDGSNCCGINQTKDGIFASKMMCNTSNLLFKAKTKGDVGLEDLLEDMPPIYNDIKLMDLGLNAGDRRRRAEFRAKSLKDYFTDVYSQGGKNNPAKMFYFLKPYRDAKGNIRYKYTYKE